MRRLFVIALLAALVPLGCGGSDDGNKSASTQSTAPESTQADGANDQSKTDTTKSTDDKTKTTKDKSKSKDDKSQTTGGGSTESPGTGGQSTPSQGTGTTKKAFIAKADRVCREFSRRLSSIGDPGADAEATVRFYRKVASQREKLYQGFSSLSKPAADTQLLARYEANLKKSASMASQIADAIENNDSVKGPALIESSSQLAEKNGKLAAKYGFRVCRG